jgi:hypothetical protein
MDAETPSAPAQPPTRHAASLVKRVALAVLVIAGFYVLAAYVVLPSLWKRYEHRHPWLADVPGVTHIKDGHPGDPLNVALIGVENDVKGVMTAAGWYPADPLGLKSDLRIAVDTVLKRSYDDAPVSNLYLFGRNEDLAFEKPVGDDPSRRHHVRYWRSPQSDKDGRPVWLGAVSYDRSVGLSRTTGQITHHISPDVDGERDQLFDDLKKTGRLTIIEAIDGFHKVIEGKNGGGDPWHTDGRLLLGIIARDGEG